MSLTALAESVRELASARRVYGEPVQVGEVTVIPAAAVYGGGGLGTGRENSAEESAGGGLGLCSRPVGAYVVHNGTVQWRPTLDLDRLVTWVGIAVVASLWRRRG